MRLLTFIRANSSTLIYTVLLGSVSLIVSSAVTYNAIRYETEIQAFDQGDWLIFFAVSCFTMAFALTPTTFVALVSGYFLGWYSVLPVALANLVASWIGYRTARWVDKGRFLGSLTKKEKARKIVENLKRNEFGIIVMSRLSPVLPFALNNVLLSLAGANLYPFLTAGLLGMLPRILLSIWVGSQAKQIRTLLEKGDGNHYLEIGLALLVIVSLAGLYYYVRSALSKKF